MLSMTPDIVDNSQFCYVLQYHIWATSQSKFLCCETRTEQRHTDVVIEAQQRSCEFYMKVAQQRLFGRVRALDGFLPLSPFMTTQMREPTHLSINSVPKL